MTLLPVQILIIAPPDRRPETPDQWLGAYIAHLFSREDIQPSTAKSYALDVGRLAAYLNDTGTTITAASREDVLRWIESMRRDGSSEAAIARRIVVARQLFAFLEERGTIATSPARDVRPPRVAARILRPPGEALDRCLSTLNASSHRTAKRDAAMIALVARAGIRMRELARLEFRDVGPGAAWVVLRQGIGAGRKIGLDLLSRQLVNEWIVARAARRFAEAPPLFFGWPPKPISRQGAWKAIRNRIRAEGISVRDLRAACVDVLTHEGMDADGIKRVLGLSETTAPRVAC